MGDSLTIKCSFYCTKIGVDIGMKGVKFYFKCDVCGCIEYSPQFVDIEDWNVDECQFKVDMACAGCGTQQKFDMNYKHCKTRRIKH